MLNFAGPYGAAAASQATEVSDTVIIVSTRAPKMPLSGGMAPAVREASEEFQNAIWYALDAENNFAKRFNSSALPETEKLVANDLKADVYSEKVDRFDVRQIVLQETIWRRHYDELCNRFVWPLCHNLKKFIVSPLQDDDIQGNHDANDLLAALIANDLKEKGDSQSPIMIQDYHHFNLARKLRERGVQNPIIFFNHIPLPTPETLNQLCDRERAYFKGLMDDLLWCDAVYFQTNEVANRFFKIIDHPEVSLDAYESTLVQRRDGSNSQVIVGHAPISINAQKVYDVSRDGRGLENQVARDLEAEMVAENILLNFERCDYSKGIRERIEAFEQLLIRRPDLRGKVQLVLGAEPTRNDIKEYQDYKAAVDDFARRINENVNYWCNRKPPVIFLNKNVPHDDVLRIMRRRREITDPVTGEVKLQRRIVTVTAFEDGMNLTSKEGAVANPGVPLILSRGAGVAVELDCNGKGAVLYIPNASGDQSALVNAMEQAIDMPEAEAEVRAHKMRDAVFNNTIQRWGKFMKSVVDLIRTPKPSAGTKPYLRLA